VTAKDLKDIKDQKDMCRDVRDFLDVAALYILSTSFSDLMV